MLILTRKIQEEISIGHIVTVKVIGVHRNGEIVLGFKAPQQIEIHRQEVYQRMYPNGLYSRAKAFESFKVSV